MSAASLSEAYSAGRTSPREVCERALSQARRWAQHCWLISIDEAEVLEQADESTRRLRAGQPRSPLEGVPIAIKDQLDVRGQPTTCGTAFLHRVAARDATAVALLRRAGAVLFGKTNLYELALGPSGQNPHHGSARNPWDPARDTGGSSSGSAALVAAGVVPLALGTDLGGSLRIPAALCGVAALKPTYGSVPTEGLLHTAWSLEHVGPIGATVDDLRRCLAVLTQEAATSVALPSPLRIGVCDSWWSRAEPDTARATWEAVHRLCAGGAIARPVVLPELDRAIDVGSLTTAVEAAAAWATEGQAQLSAPVRVTLAIGRAVTAVDYVQAQRTRRAVCDAIDAVFRDVHVLLLPTTHRAACRYSPCCELDDDAIVRRIAFTLPFNLGGWPAAQIPCGFDANGLPIGLQIVGPRGADLLVLSAALAAEAAVERRSPPEHAEI